MAKKDNKIERQTNAFIHCYIAKMITRLINIVHPDFVGFICFQILLMNIEQA